MPFVIIVQKSNYISIAYRVFITQTFIDVYYQLTELFWQIFFDLVYWKQIEPFIFNIPINSASWSLFKLLIQIICWKLLSSIPENEKQILYLSNENTWKHSAISNIIVFFSFSRSVRTLIKKNDFFQLLIFVQSVN